MPPSKIFRLPTHPLHTPRIHVARARRLRGAIQHTRGQLLDVLHARARTLATAPSWVGPHRERYDREAEQLLAAGRALDDALAQLLATLDAEVDDQLAR